MFMCTKFKNVTVYDNSAGLLLKCSNTASGLVKLEIYGYYSHSYLLDTGEQGNL